MGRFDKLERPGAAAPDAAEAPPPAEGRPLAQANTPFGAEPSAYDYSNFTRQGDEHFFMGEYRDALRFYSKALQSQTTSPYPWIAQVTCLVMMKQYKEAEMWARRALDSFPEEPSLLSTHAIALAHLGMVKRALGVSDYALGKGGDAFVWLARGIVLLAAKNANANFCFGKALELAGSDWRIPMRAGIALMEAKDYASALEHLQRAAALNMENAFLWKVIGDASVKLAFSDRADAAYKRAAALKPGYKAVEKGLHDMANQGIVARMMGRLRRK